MPCQYSFKENLLAVKWRSERIAKEKKIAEDALARNQERGSSKGITVRKAVVHLRKQENNCFRLQYNLVVTSKLFFEWDND